MDTQATIKTTDGVQTATFKIAADEEVLTAIMNDAAAYLFEKGFGNHGTEEEPVTFNSLTNLEKVIMVDGHLKQVVLDLANTQKSQKAQEGARIIEEANKYELGVK